MNLAVAQIILEFSSNVKLSLSPKSRMLHFLGIVFEDINNWKLGILSLRTEYIICVGYNYTGTKNVKLTLSLFRHISSFRFILVSCIYFTLKLGDSKNITSGRTGVIPGVDEG